MQNQQQTHNHTVFRQTTAQFLLRGVSGVTFGRSFTLVGSMVIGRLSSCDITIPNDEISRQHARIVTRPGSILLEDLGSANGTFVNGKPVDKAVIKVGDEIRFDKIRFQIQSLNQVEELLSEPFTPPVNPSKKTATFVNKKTLALGLLGSAVIASLLIGIFY